jgi:hypothetical protein
MKLLAESNNWLQFLFIIFIFRPTIKKAMEKYKLKHYKPFPICERNICNPNSQLKTNFNLVKIYLSWRVPFEWKQAFKLVDGGISDTEATNLSVPATAVTCFWINKNLNDLFELIKDYGEKIID